MNKVNEEKILNLAGLAYRARKVSLGVDTIINDIQKRRVNFVLIATDAQKNSKKQLIDKCRTYAVPYGEVANRQALGSAIGKHERVAIGINDQGFARKFQSLLQK